MEGHHLREIAGDAEHDERVGWSLEVGWAARLTRFLLGGHCHVSNLLIAAEAELGD
jgi:hypothetical protein